MSRPAGTSSAPWRPGLRASCATVMLLLLLCASASAEAPLRISTSYRTLFSTPEQTGMLDRIIKEAFQRVGLNAEIVFTPTARSLVEVNSGMLDGEINRIAGMERRYPDMVCVPEPNMQMHFVAFATKDIPISGWNSLVNLHVGVVTGWKILEEHVREFPHVTYAVEEKQLFEMLEMGRLDVVLYSRLGGRMLIKQLGYRDIVSLSPPLLSRDMFLYLHKGHRTLCRPLAEALRGMKRDGTYERIVRETHRDLELPYQLP